ncbi:tetratricopeptide repeat protein [Acaryochloris marina]|uniref:tetratricopeptide repeat protein n=1 Tax=Acaryochloris marina TaxID=155978 RepID=UPI001BAFF92D|nr:tetratricopeptide repeat protein [Acaryochloris marina]QUY42631.1 tetratricopeptide repeat protein [Acaryochloris marina S15]
MLSNLALVILVSFIFFLSLVIFASYKVTQIVQAISKIEISDPDKFPPIINKALKDYIQNLKSLNFKFIGYYHIFTTANDPPAWELLFQDPSSSKYCCLIALQPFQDVQKSIFIEMLSILQNSTFVITTNIKDYGSFLPYSGEIKQSLVHASINDLLYTHELQLRKSTVSPIALEPNAFHTKLMEHNKAHTTLSVNSGNFHWIEEGNTYRHSFKNATKLVINILFEQWFSPKNTKTTYTLDQNTQIEYETQTFLESRASRSVETKSQSKWLILASLAAFTASFATQFEPIALLIFIGAIILHEGGHLLAMLLFGYSSPSVLFIPFLGALATARKENASLTEKFWISLAGPLPGLILGIGIAIAGNSGQAFASLFNNLSENIWQETSSILIILNLFNLLPIYPLDGGQISDLLVFSRNPYLGCIYKSFGALMLFLLGLSNPLILIFSILIAASIPASFKIARWSSELRQDLREIPEQDEAAAAQLIFTKLQDAPELSYAQKKAIASGILEMQRTDTAPLRSRIGLSIIYLVCLVVGICGGIYSLFSPRQLEAIVQDVGKSESQKREAQFRRSVENFKQYASQQNEEAFRQEIKTATQKIQNNPQDSTAYLRRGYAKLALKDIEGSITDANLVINQFPDIFESYYLRSQAHTLAGDLHQAKADRQKGNEIRWLPEIAKATKKIKQNPENIEALMRRGNAKQNIGDQNGAIQDYSTALQINPQNTETLIKRALLYQQQERYPAALKDLNLALSIDPKNAWAYESRAEIHFDMGYPNKAKADLTKSEEFFN